MKINERLNLVVPLYDETDKVYAWVHSTPISYEVFKANFWLVSRTYSAIMGGELGLAAGPRVAALVMEDVAERIGGDQVRGAEVSKALTAEIRRLSTVIMPNGNGWEPVPFDAAIKRGLLEPEDVMDVESAIVFFLVILLICPRNARMDLLSGVNQIWGGQLSSLNVTGFIDSLQTSIVTENSGATVVVS